MQLQNLVVLRALADLTQRQLATATGLPQQTLSDYERRVPCLNSQHVDTIARALGVSALALTVPDHYR